MTSQEKLEVGIRPAIATMPGYVPGARPTSGIPMTKLSSNENPNSPEAAVLTAIRQAAGEINRYPDMFGIKLTRELAAHYGVDPGQIVLGNGSVAVLAHALTALIRPGDNVIYPWRSFEAYPLIVRTVGAESIPIPLTDQLSHDLAAMTQAVTERTRVVIICNPNNPTGNVLSRTEIMDFIAQIPPSVAVFLDEAYAEYLTEPGFSFDLADLKRHPNVLVFRTFSKAYGLAGLRVGYAIGDPRLITAVRHASTPFGVNSLAQAAAQVALAQPEVMREHVDKINAERTRIVTELRAAGWLIGSSGGNFYYLPIREAAAELAAAGLAQGMLVRSYPGDGVRVSVGSKAENDRLLAFLMGFEPNSSTPR